MPSVLITGTSSGFGLSIAVELARAGWTVLATMRDTSKRNELDRAVQAAGVTRNVSVSQLDVTDPLSIDRALAELDITAGGLDAVVHNAGVAVGGAFEDLDETSIRRIMDVNYFGVLALTKRLLPVFRAQRRGRIVIISSESAFAGQPGNSPYCASKSGLNRLPTKSSTLGSRSSWSSLALTGPAYGRTPRECCRTTAPTALS